MKGSVEFGIENVEGIAVITGLAEEPLELGPGERLTLRQEVSLDAGEVRPGVLDASCLKERP
jgi:hypothetical protein